MNARTPDPVYEVHAIRYATVPRDGSHLFVGGDPHERGLALDYFVWLIRGEGQTVVVDTGFGADAAARRDRRFIEPPASGLAALGVDAAQVRDVIITHLHYDHVGGFEAFPAATFHLQDAEMRFATGRCMRHAFFAHAYEVEEVVAMVRQVYAGRVCFHDGDEEIIPGVTVHRIGGHTEGLQCVRIATAGGPLVLASDAMHLYANAERGRPFPIVHDVARMFEGWDRLLSLAGHPDRIVPGHDPAVMERFPPSSEALAGRAVRLDLGRVRSAG